MKKVWSICDTRYYSLNSLSFILSFSVFIIHFAYIIMSQAQSTRKVWSVFDIIVIVFIHYQFYNIPHNNIIGAGPSAPTHHREHP
jgi:hypothetical protein